MPLPTCTRLDIADEVGRAALLSEGWREIEILETWEGDVEFPALDLSDNIRLAQASDLPTIERIARESFTHDRFHADPTIGKEKADDTKARSVMARWAIGHGYYVFVHGDPATAFVIVYQLEYLMTVALIAVDAPARRGTIAGSMIDHAAWCLKARRRRAGTQSTNEAAKRLYASLGMSVVKRERTFHKP